MEGVTGLQMQFVVVVTVMMLPCRRLGTAAQALLAGYVAAHGRQLTIAVRRSADSTNWLQARL